MAFEPVSIAFAAPTPQPLAAALNELVYGDEASMVTLVLREDDDALLGAVSATEAGANGDIFPADELPPFALIGPIDGQGFNGQVSQKDAYLHFADTKGSLSLKLADLTWTASSFLDCQLLVLEVSATIPSSEFSTVLHYSGGERTIGELAPATDEGESQTQKLHFFSKVLRTNFDFDSL